MDVQPPELEILGQEQYSKRMIWVFTHIQIALFVEVAQQILDVIHIVATKLVHAMHQGDKRVSQMLAYH